MAMKLSTGKVAFPIEFDNGDKQNIYFNPTDPDLFLRFQELKGRLIDKISGMADYEINEDGTPKNQSEYELFKAFRNLMCEEINRAFGNDVCTVLFKYVNPLAIVEGDYYVLYVIEKLLPEIKKHINNSNEKANKKMQEYIKDYVKK